VLTGGLLGALALRIVFIVAGLAVVDAVRSAMIGFAVVLVASGAQMLRPRATHAASPAAGPRWLPDRIRRRPALLAFVAILVIDVAFAADSILAAFAVTTNAFPIIAANVFAVLGLRPLYEVMRDAIDRFRYLRTGIGLLLVAVGVELGLEDFVHLPPWVTLVAVVAFLGGSILASWLAGRDVSMRRACRVIAVTGGGFALLAAGAAMLVLPGPGLLVVVAGLAVLSKEYAWARRPLGAVRRRLRRRSA
jgi:tellurite resistance protein TerC